MVMSSCRNLVNRFGRCEARFNDIDKRGKETFVGASGAT